MRCVEYDVVQIEWPEGWEERAAALRQQLIDEEDELRRAELIENNRDIWAEVKAKLRDLFNRKCWYTEAPQQGTDVDVDHFRPKKRVAEARDKAKPHPGYWWLAFSPENYRYSCIVANRRRRDVNTGIVGGKADHFPLWDEKKRAWTPECDRDEEEPLLLDPCEAADVALITFKEDGEAMSRFAEEDSVKAYKRADTSIEYYHLNHTDFVKERIKLREDMKVSIKNAKKAFQKIDGGDAFHETTFKSAIKRLRGMRSEKAPYSSFCVAYLDKFKRDKYLAGVFM